MAAQQREGRIHLDTHPLRDDPLGRLDTDTGLLGQTFDGVGTIELPLLEQTDGGHIRYRRATAWVPPPIPPGSFREEVERTQDRPQVVAHDDLGVAALAIATAIAESDARVLAAGLRLTGRAGLGPRAPGTATRPAER